MIAEGVALLDARARDAARVGPYRVQAAIAALHDEAPSADATDWPQIAALYRRCSPHGDNPMVRLSHAIAVGMVEGPRAGLAALDAVAADPRMAGNIASTRRARTCSSAPAITRPRSSSIRRAADANREHARAQLPAAARRAIGGALTSRGSA